MGKRTYRSVSVKDVEAERLAERLAASTRVVFGVDVAKVNFMGAFRSPEQGVVETVRWKSPEDLDDVVGLLGRVGGPSRVEVALEPSGTYGDCLLARLWAAGYRVFKVSPKRSHDASEVYDGVPSKHDAKDAALLGKLHLDGVSRPWVASTDAQRDLAAAMEVLELHQRQRLANECRLEAKLARHWPELPRILQLGSATMLALLEEFGSPQQVGTNPDQARATMARVGGRLLTADKREAVIKSAQTSIGQKMTNGERKALQELARETNRNRLAGNEAQEVVEQLVENNVAVQRVAKVVGKVTAASLEVGLGPAAGYPNAASYVKGAGLNVKECSSGEHRGQVSITKRGPSHVRRYLFLAVLRLIYREPCFKAWHIAKVGRQGGEDKMKSVVALMRKLLGALWHVARGSEFDPSKLFDIGKLGLAALQTGAGEDAEVPC